MSSESERSEISLGEIEVRIRQRPFADPAAQLRSLIRRNERADTRVAVTCTRSSRNRRVIIAGLNEDTSKELATISRLCLRAADNASATCRPSRLLTIRRETKLHLREPTTKRDPRVSSTRNCFSNSWSIFNVSRR